VMDRKTRDAIVTYRLENASRTLNEPEFDARCLRSLTLGRHDGASVGRQGERSDVVLLRATYNSYTILVRIFFCHEYTNFYE
jgi:hypothetical protein